jgi:hypothetical protein
MSREQPRHYLVLDDVTYHRTDSAEIPQGFAEVDVKLDDNGQNFDTTLVAGLVGTLICDSGDKSLSEEGKRDTAKPFSAWWIFARPSDGKQAKDHEEVQEESSNPERVFGRSPDSKGGKVKKEFFDKELCVRLTNLAQNFV